MEKNNCATVTDLFYKEFSRINFYSETDYNSYIELARNWWQINHNEDQQNYKVRIDYIPPPPIFGIVHIW